MLYPETKKQLLEFIGLSPAFVNCHQQKYRVMILKYKSKCSHCYQYCYGPPKKLLLFHTGPTKPPMCIAAYLIMSHFLDPEDMIRRADCITTYGNLIEFKIRKTTVNFNYFSLTHNLINFKTRNRRYSESLVTLVQ